MFVITTVWIYTILSKSFPKLELYQLGSNNHVLNLYTDYAGTQENVLTCTELTKTFIAINSNGAVSHQKEDILFQPCEDKLKAYKHDVLLEIDNDNQQFTITAPEIKRNLYLGYYLPTQSLLLSDMELFDNSSFLQSNISLSGGLAMHFDIDTFLESKPFENKNTLSKGDLDRTCTALEKIYSLIDVKAAETNPFVNFPFQAISDQRNRFMRYSLPYWLHYCDIYIPTFHIRDVFLANDNDARQSSTDQSTEIIANKVYPNSLCIVKNIQWTCSVCNQTILHSLPMIAANHDHNYPCVEDMLDYYLLPFRTGASLNTAEESSFITNTTQPKFTFVINRDLAHAEDLSKYYFAELLVFLKAVMNTPSAVMTNVPLQVHIRSWNRHTLLHDHIPLEEDALTLSTLPAAAGHDALKLIEELPYQIPSSVTAPPDIVIGSEGNVHVLILVPAEHLLLAQYLVDYKRRHCGMSTCHIFMSYIIIPFNDPDHDTQQDITQLNPENITMQEIVEFLSRTASYHTWLLEVEQFVTEISHPHDLVYIFNGLPALLAFPQPSVVEAYPLSPERQQQNKFFFFPEDCQNNRPIIPIVQYASRNNYCLDAEIMIATMKQTASLDTEDMEAMINMGGVDMEGSTGGLQINHTPKPEKAAAGTGKEKKKASKKTLKKKKKLKRYLQALQGNQGNFHAMVGTVRSIQWWVQSVRRYYTIGKYEMRSVKLTEILNAHAAYHAMINPFTIHFDITKRAFDTAWSQMFLSALAWKTLVQLNPEAAAAIPTQEIKETFAQSTLSNADAQMVNEMKNILLYTKDAYLYRYESHLFHMHSMEVTKAMIVKEIPITQAFPMKGLSIKSSSSLKKTKNNIAEEEPLTDSEHYQELIDAFQFSILYCDSCLEEIKSFFSAHSSYTLTIPKLKALIEQLAKKSIVENALPSTLQIQVEQYLPRKQASCLIPFALFEDILNMKIRQILPAGHWYAISLALVKLIPSIATCPFTRANAVPIANNFIQLAKNSKFVYTITTANEYYYVYHLLEYSLRHHNFFPYRYVAGDDSVLLSHVEIPTFTTEYPIMTAMRMCQSLVITELGIQPMMKQAYQQSLLHRFLSYEDVSERRINWRRDKIHFITQFISSPYSCPSSTSSVTPRKDLNGIVNGRKTSYHIYYVTYASQYTQEVKNLLLTATLSGIRLEVLGMNEPYHDYSNKILAYFRYLHAPNSLLQDDDVIVLMDAYDVVVFPSIRHVDEVLMHSPAPIVFCNEAGIYPEYSSSYFYSRANGPQNQVHQQLYLNSGCIIAQVKYMKWLFAQALSLIPVIRDDQQIFVRTFLAYPDMITLDHNHQFAMTFYQQNKYLPEFTISAAMQLYLKDQSPFNPFHTMAMSSANHILSASQQSVLNHNANKVMKLHPIGIAHANNKGSNTVYPYLVNTIFHLFESYYRGRGDGSDLFQVIRYMADKQYKLAKELLQASSSIRLNSTTTTSGGKNGVNQLLLYEIEHGLLATNESSVEAGKGKLSFS